jgi:hypothetical protein
MTASVSREPGPASGEVFARLVGELDELGFEATRPAAHPHHTVYTATDSGVAVTIVASACEPHVYVAARPGTGPAWSMHWTAAAPPAIQLIALYAAVNDDPAAALTAAAAALGIPPPDKAPNTAPAGPARPPPSAG